MNYPEHRTFHNTSYKTTKEEDNKLNSPKNSPHYLPRSRKVRDHGLKDWQEVFTNLCLSILQLVKESLHFTTRIFQGIDILAAVQEMETTEEREEVLKEYKLHDVSCPLQTYIIHCLRTNYTFTLVVYGSITYGLSFRTIKHFSADNSMHKDISKETDYALSYLLLHCV
ncbi:uncharacterized protein F5891DRAFT_1168738 [Suillus fuscotomentosus]|uniref:Uncharacterized protein n=1 Tax=Suillus fuscotomentosus TaxID=1912939 RepID=A0AAD4EM17_9AGAM|nr:uncharacterized protein F5891DRAFT_1168738 [Suillus fuscotomentosus]KAG1908665.1 hypothetical protein F5891DRAFT_1168738 [Suillus fuscotomentosus]